ncbi:MAG: histidine kinase [Anaerolineales bacterium]|nr:histidine kinase [Anaerolineales bacterium]
MIQAEEEALRVAQAAADHQNEVVEGARQLLFALAQMPAVREPDPATCNAFLSAVKKYNPRYTNILKVGLDGSVLCDAISSHFTGKVPDDGFIQRVAATRAFSIGNYVISPTTKRPSIGFGYPILDDRGDVQAVLVAGLDLSSLEEWFTQAATPPQATFALRDRNGTILAYYPESNKWVGQADPVTQISKAITDSKEEGTVEAIGPEGVPELYAYAPLPGAPDAGVYIRVGIPKEIAFEKVNQTLYRNLATLGVVAALVFVVAWICSEFFFLRQIKAMVKTTKEIATGNFSHRTRLHYGKGELGGLAQTIDQMGEALEKREQERREAHEAMIHEEEARAQLLHNLITAHEDERIRIARELHDETSQSLTALMVGFDTVCLALGKDDSKAKEYLENVKGIAEGMLNEIHRLISDLRPSSLDDLGLVPAILSYAEERLKPCGIALQLSEDGIEGRLPAVVETAMFRIIQEAFTNIIRHSHASKVDVRLGFSGSDLLLRLTDNGDGFDLATIRAEKQCKGFGLQGMQERVHMLGGEFEIVTAPGEGTGIIIRVPLPESIQEYV